MIVGENNCWRVNRFLWFEKKNLIPNVPFQQNPNFNSENAQNLTWSKIKHILIKK